MEYIVTASAPAAIGPYSQAIATEGGRLVFVSGQLPLDPASGELCTGSIAEQTCLIASNIASILEEAGTDLAHVVQTTCYLADLGNFAEFNEEYAKHFTSNPARACVQASLPKGADVEVAVIAEL